MAWVKLDDSMPEDLKVVAFSDAAFRAYVTSICYSARLLTDGFVPMRLAKQFAGRPRVIQELAPDPWHVTPNICAECRQWPEALEACKSGEGFYIHVFLRYNPTRAQIEADREVSRRRSAMNANPYLTQAVRERDGDFCRYCAAAVNWRDRKGAKGGTYDHVIPLSKGGLETVENLVVACRQCNFRKGARSPEEAGLILLPESSRNLAGIKPVSGFVSSTPDPDPVPGSPIPFPDPDDAVAERRNIFVLYDMVFTGGINGLLREELIALEEEHPADCIEHCFKAAAMANPRPRTLLWVKARLEAHRRDGCDGKPDRTDRSKPAEAGDNPRVAARIRGLG